MAKVTAKVFINAGHGGRDSGAVGYVVEKDANLKMAIACKNYLEKNGVEVYMAKADLNDESQSSTDVLNEIARFKPDYAIDVHNNAGGGDGFEVYIGIGGSCKKLAANIEAEVKKIGQNSRGIKTRVGSDGKDYYYFIRCTSCPAIILEGAFVDNKADAAQIDTDAECKKFGEAYAKGILKTLGIKDSTTGIKTGQSGFKVKVTANALNIRAGAGTKYNINGVIRDQGVYTIVETRGDWGKLKSGAGWINLKYTKRV